MSRLRVDVSLAVLIPFVLGGLAALCVLGMDIALERGLFGLVPERSQSYYTAAVAGLAVFGAGLAFARMILVPVRRFVEGASKIEVLSEPMRNIADTRGQELESLTQVFDHVTQVLGSLDAKALFPGVIGESRAMRSVLTYVLKVAPREATVLLTGESGTGKDLFANTIHQHSKRKDKAFLAVNCAAIPPGLMESELFGHEKGAFTGAVAAKKGKFEQADGGTLFLDEIGDMPLETQAKILRALENGEAERVGGAKPVRFNVRLVAATNKNLPEMIKANTFRDDLFHRLNVFPLTLPPLRERPEDIPPLATHFLERFGPTLTIATRSLQLLMTHHWPGNVRELRNTLERATVLAGDEGQVLPEHLPAQLRLAVPTQAGAMLTPASENLSLNLDERLEEMEKNLIISALLRSKGVQVRAASMLGIKERSLWHRVKKFGLEPGDYKGN